MHLAKRKELYEALHPETKHGAKNKSNNYGANLEDDTMSFSKDAAVKTGKNERTIQREVAERLKPMREVVRDELEIPLSGRQPGPGRGHKTRDNVTPFPDRGNSASYTLRRLKRARRWSQPSNLLGCFSLAIFLSGHEAP